MSVDRDAQGVLDMLAAAGRSPLNELPPSEAREGSRASRAIFVLPPPPVQMRDLVAAGPEGEIPLRLYRSLDAAVDQELPLFVFMHGGGWVIGDLDSGNWFCASLVERLGIAVIAVDYRLAPEHRFPAAADDCIAALDWIVANAAELGVRADGIAVGGDSAGGNLATVCALHARDTGSPRIAAQILLYPVTDISTEHGSYARNADGYMLTAVMMRYFKAQYLNGASAEDWRASPLRAKLDGLAPAFVVTCGYDPLCDEGTAYAEALDAAGVAVRHIRYDGQIHGFAMWSKVVRDSHNVLDQIIEELRLRLFC